MGKPQWDLTWWDVGDEGETRVEMTLDTARIMTHLKEMCRPRRFRKVEIKKCSFAKSCNAHDLRDHKNHLIE